MGETTDNINEVISTGGNFALLAEVIEFLKKKRKKEEKRTRSCQRKITK